MRLDQSLFGKATYESNIYAKWVSGHELIFNKFGYDTAVL